MHSLHECANFDVRHAKAANHIYVSVIFWKRAAEERAVFAGNQLRSPFPSSEKHREAIRLNAKKNRRQIGAG